MGGHHAEYMDSATCPSSESKEPVDAAQWNCWETWMDKETVPQSDRDICFLRPPTEKRNPSKYQAFL